MIKRYSDHAANERTFLAWVRTAIAVMAFGFRDRALRSVHPIRRAATGAAADRAARPGLCQCGRPRLHRHRRDDDRDRRLSLCAKPPRTSKATTRCRAPANASISRSPSLVGPPGRSAVSLSVARGIAGAVACDLEKGLLQCRADDGTRISDEMRFSAPKPTPSLLR